jgi:oxygen-dependent protoporphyrinogen oxidase
MEGKYGSLTRATLRAMRRRHASYAAPGGLNSLDSGGTGQSPVRQAPLFMTLKGGLEQLTQTLASHLQESRIHLARRVAAIEPRPGGPDGVTDSCSRKYLIRCEGGIAYDADAVILALPAEESSRLLASVDSSMSELLGSIPYSSSMTVSLAYDDGVREELPLGFGFLVPRQENRRILACTFVHAKFHHRVPKGKALLRCFLGGSRDPEVLSLTDGEVVALVREELENLFALSSGPLFYRVHRWPSSMAQYVVGHKARLEEIHARLDEHPGLFLAGNGYAGIGISDCIRTGRAAAERALDLAKTL